jgi:RNA polymerase sigma-70 factor (ECF subfamily)
MGVVGKPMQTADLLKQIAAGDRQAFASLYSALRPTLLRYAAGLLAGEAEAAADVVDEAFMDVWRLADRFEGRGSADGWIYRITRNKAVDWLRSRRERPLAGEIEESLIESVPDNADTPEEALQKVSAADELRRAMDRLSPEHREAIWLCYFEERSLAEIATIAGCPENTVKTRLFHARRLLRGKLERSHEIGSE